MAEVKAMIVTESQLRKIIREEEERVSEMREFSRSRSGRKVMNAGSKIKSAAGVISEVSKDQTGAMARTLRNISEFVEKVGTSLSEIGMLQEGESATERLPTVKELKQLHKDIQRLEK
jgi:hypothetical protein